MTLPELFAFTRKPEPDAARSEGMFYAQSWALADLLMLSPSYRADFPALLAALASGVPAERALEAVYHMPLAAVERDLRARVARGSSALPLPAVAGPSAQTSDRTRDTVRVARHAGRSAPGQWRSCRGRVRLPRTRRGTARLGRSTQPPSARSRSNAATPRPRSQPGNAPWNWASPTRISVSATPSSPAQRGLPTRTALERAVALRPDFDDARFALALLEKNAGHAEAAVGQLRAMRQIAPRAPSPIGARWPTRCSIWTAAPKPNRRPPKPDAHAAGDEEREHAAQLAWLADTELAVEIEGQKFHTVRVPVGAASRNPFIEPGDRVQRTEATMRQVDCPENGIQLVLDTAQGALTLAIPDPSRVQIRNAGSIGIRVRLRAAGAAQSARGIRARRVHRTRPGVPLTLLPDAAGVGLRPSAGPPCRRMPSGTPAYSAPRRSRGTSAASADRSAPAGAALPRVRSSTRSGRTTGRSAAPA